MILGDTVQLAEFIQRNITLYQIRNTYPLRPSAAAAWIRRSLADSLRSRNPYSVNLLVAGYDPSVHEPSLYWIDYLGTLTQVPFAAHGYGAYFVLSLLDKLVFLCVCIHSHELMNAVIRYHNPDASLEEGLAVLKRCVQELAKRLIVSPDKYKVKVVDKDGVREVNLM